MDPTSYSVPHVLVNGLCVGPGGGTQSHDGPGPVSDSGTSLSVVISTHNRPDLLARCLSSLRGLQPQPGEVIVVENAATGAQGVADRFGARYIAELRPGLSRARNTGARHAR